MADQDFNSLVAGIYTIGVIAVLGALLMYFTVPLGTGRNIDDRDKGTVVEKGA